MKIAVFAFSRQGCRTARRIAEQFSKEELRSYTMERFEEPGFDTIQPPSAQFYGPIFCWADAMVFVGAAGIAVRKIAPYVRDKATDPAVVSVDELGQFVIPLLSGHIGGANELALKIAAALQATPVITTATDINHRFSVDAWAAQNGYEISNLRCAKAVSAEILERDVPLCSDFPIVTTLPNGLMTGDSGSVGIYISYRTTEPFTQTLRLIPRILHLGIGCHRNASAVDIERAVDTVLEENRLDPCAVKAVDSIDLKANEVGLLQFCRHRGWTAQFHSAAELRTVKGTFASSAFVEKITGVDNVCERAACFDAGCLIVKKTVYNSVTVAVAAEKWEVHFG